MDLLRRSLLSFCLLVAVSGLSSAPGVAEPAESITVASTTSTEQSGLFKELLPQFTQASGIGVKVVALGTGQALDAARRGDADVALVHDTAAEEKFVGEGWSTKRYPVMYNDFVIVGPKDDPAGAAGASVVEALRKIAAAKAPFVSRGDRSGTHSAELRYWKEAGLDLGAVRGDWYKDVGQGMGPALNTASAANAYVLSDRGTWLSFKNRGDLKILVEGDKRLFNQYGVMVVNPEKHPHVKAKAAQAFVDWLVSAPGQAAIAAYRIGGEQLFFPNAESR
ncbi:extracellular solute-binding protein [Methylobacterium sp. Leaf85]|uniref:extracellular solute-binding protein n=1 Tax=Methylobacterium sp. Leaf85 TaxID=1736241 RepID=UPI0006F7A498|nr:extracellular solute-binding protein [Methylobacterium sp. Leaf85]KQO42976.1 tungsten ABC transporter substrate-binding protein [Methylobacterium sp. Leaf85]